MQRIYALPKAQSTPKHCQADDLRLDALDASLEMFIRAILNGMAFFILCTLYVACLLYSFVIRNVMIVASRSLRLRPDQRQDHKHPSDPWLCISMSMTMSRQRDAV